MDATTMARDLLHEGHETVEQAIGGLSEEQINTRLAGSTLDPISLIYLHTVTGEDGVINALIRGEPTIWERNGWAGRFGLPADLPTTSAWDQELRIADFGAVREYAKEVYASSDAYLASVSPAAFEELRPTPLGERTVGYLVSVWVGWHVCHHGGELCALKGVLGQKGMSF